jgi:uncharacterized low-complexity protein
MIRTSSRIGALALVFVLSAPVLADAASRRAQRYAPQDEPAAYSLRAAGRCQAWCDRDFSPCDPPHFKVADGRCGAILPNLAN